MLINVYLYLGWNVIYKIVVSLQYWVWIRVIHRVNLGVRVTFLTMIMLIMS